MEKHGYLAGGIALYFILIVYFLKKALSLKYTLWFASGFMMLAYNISNILYKVADFLGLYRQSMHCLLW